MLYFLTIIPDMHSDHLLLASYYNFSNNSIILEASLITFSQCEPESDFLKENR